MGFLLIWGNRPLLSLSNKDVAGLVSPQPLGVNLICDRSRFRSLLVSRNILIVHFFKFYACFYVAIALVVIGWCYGLPYNYLPTKLSEHIWCEVHAYIWNKFLSESKFCVYYLSYLSQVISCQTFCLCHNRKCAAVIYNAQKCFIFNKKYQTNTFQDWPGSKLR